MSEAVISPKELIRFSPELWASTFGQIRDVSGKSVPFKLNVLQRRIFALWKARNLRGKPVRAIGLKPRKRGFSSAVAALQYVQLSRNIHEGVVIGDKLETSDIVFRMIAHFAQTDSFGGWGSPVEVTAERIKWQHGSRVSQATARGKATCRGMTPQFMHLTEAAHFENAEDAMDAAMNAVPDEGFSTIFIESTPFGAGEPFALKWEGARWPRAEECPGEEEYWRQWESFCPDVEDAGGALGDMNFVRVFAAWYEFEESAIRLTDVEKEEIERSLDARTWYAGERRLIDLYGNEGPRGMRLGREVVGYDVWEQLAWRRMTIRNKCRGSVRVFDSEHPADPRSCFLSAGRQVFDAEALDWLTELSLKYRGEYGQVSGGSFVVTREEEANVVVWERPKVGCRYLVVVDPAEGEDQTKGEDPDCHSVQVWRDEYVDEGGVIQLARLVARAKWPCRVPMIPLARLVRDLCWYYGKCIVIPEMNNSGMSLIMALRMMDGWSPAIWQRREMDPHSGRERAWDGWRTTDTKGYGGVRSTIIWHLHEKLREQRLVISCPQAISELRGFVDKGGRMEAGGGHDDDVMCCHGEMLVRCKDGVKPIRDVRVGDEVLTHKGRYRKVTKTMERDAGDLVRVKSTGKLDLVVTSEHPIYAARAFSRKRKRPQGAVLDYEHPQFIPVAVAGMDAWEYGATSVALMDEEDVWTLDLLPYCSEGYVESGGKLVATTYNGTRINPKGARISRHVEVDEDFCRFLGFYFAQGGYGRHTVTLCYNVTHKGIDQWLEGYVRRLGLCPSKQVVAGCQRLSFGSVPWVNFFKEEFGVREHKRFPAWVELLPVKKQRWILEGYFLGDGCFSRGVATSVTISRQGAWQLWEMGMRCGLEVAMGFRMAAGKHKAAYVLTMARPAAGRLKLGIPLWMLEGKINDDSFIKADQTNMKFGHGYLIGKVLSVEPESPARVYNLEVEDDESYTANGYVVHNCTAIAVYNLRDAVEYVREVREWDLPPDLLKERERSGVGRSRGLAMRS